MTNEQKSVRDWMAKASQETPDKPTIPSLEVRKLRARLILEEALETINRGLGIEVFICDHGENKGVWNDRLRFEDGHEYVRGWEPNIVELADGLSDLQVVNLGTAVACGIDLEPCFREVMRSNDSKFQWHRNDLKEAAQKCCYQIGPSQSEGPEWIETRVLDVGGKVIKPPTYSPANLEPIIEQQTKGNA